jgi:hypothetical protein
LNAQKFFPQAEKAGSSQFAIFAAPDQAFISWE